MARRKVLAGSLPRRVVRPARVTLPDPKVFAELTAGSGKQAVSTTMAFARLLRNLVRDPAIGPLVAPIVPDEARTFGLEPIIAEAKIYAPEGQRYVPVDADLPLNYAESDSGQILEEGITEAGGLATFTALATAYATWGQPMLPVFLFYSMFGFQRVGDLIWALGDMRGRGFLAGCTAGRTTLNGEGLQHDDGHSPLLASTNPAAAVYDPAFAYEVAVVIEDAIHRMLGPDPEDRFCYLTLYNENYLMPALPEGPRATSSGKASSAASTASPSPPRPKGVPRPRRRRSAGQPVLLRADVAGGHGGPASCWPRSGASRPTPGRSPRGPSCAPTPYRPSGGTASTPAGRPASRS